MSFIPKAGIADICPVLISFLPLSRKYLCLSWKPQKISFFQRASHHPSDWTLVKTRTSSASGEQSVGFGRQDSGSCVKRSHMDYEWQPSVNTRSLASHGQYHHPAISAGRHAPNGQNKVAACCRAPSVAKQQNAGEHSCRPARPNTVICLSCVWCCGTCREKAAAARTVSLAGTPLTQGHTLLPAAYRTAERAGESVCSCGSVCSSGRPPRQR